MKFSKKFAENRIRQSLSFATHFQAYFLTNSLVHFAVIGRVIQVNQLILLAFDPLLTELRFPSPPLPGWWITATATNYEPICATLHEMPSGQWHSSEVEGIGKSTQLPSGRIKGDLKGVGVGLLQQITDSSKCTNTLPTCPQGTGTTDSMAFTFFLSALPDKL